MAVNGYELDWDSTIENDEQQYTLLDEGDYPRSMQVPRWQRYT